MMNAIGAGYYVSTAGKIVVFAIAATSLNLVLGYGGMLGRLLPGASPGLLAFEHGRVGQRYLLGGENLSMREVFGPRSSPPPAGRTSSRSDFSSVRRGTLCHELWFASAFTS